MAYTPELSYRGSATLRRLAWFRSKPMTKTLEARLEATGRTMAHIRAGDVCAKCMDSSTCEECLFQPPANNDCASQQDQPAPPFWERGDRQGAYQRPRTTRSNEDSEKAAQKRLNEFALKILPSLDNFLPGN